MAKSIGLKNAPSKKFGKPSGKGRGNNPPKTSKANTSNSK